MVYADFRNMQSLTRGKLRKWPILQGMLVGVA